MFFFYFYYREMQVFLFIYDEFSDLEIKVCSCIIYLVVEL